MPSWNGSKRQPSSGYGDVAGLPGLTFCGSNTSGQNRYRCVATTLPLESATVRSRKFRRPLKPCRMLDGSGLVVVEPSGRWMTCVMVTGLA